MISLLLAPSTECFHGFSRVHQRRQKRCLTTSRAAFRALTAAVAVSLVIQIPFVAGADRVIDNSAKCDSVQEQSREQEDSERDLSAPDRSNDRLRLKFNKGSLIPSVERLSRLRSLEVYGHMVFTQPRWSLADGEADKLKTLDQLDTLSFHRCEITDPAISELGTLRSLTSLTIRNCDPFTGATLHQIPNLTDLSCEGCKQLNDQGVKAIGHLRCLERLTLQECWNVTDEGLKHLANLKSLSQLRLRLPFKSSGQMSWIVGIEKLSLLDVTGVRKGDDSLFQMSKLRLLTNLSICASKISNTGMSSLAEMQQLQCLKLDHCDWEEDGLSVLRGAVSLKTVLLIGAGTCPISDNSIKGITGVESIEDLEIDGSQTITARGYSELRTMHRLKSLSVTGIGAEENDKMAELRNLSRLKSLLIRLRINTPHSQMKELWAIFHRDLPMTDIVMESDIRQGSLAGRLRVTAE